MLYTVLNAKEIFIAVPNPFGQPLLDVANRAQFVGEQSFDADELPTAAPAVLDVDHCRMHSVTRGSGEKQ